MLSRPRKHQRPRLSPRYNFARCLVVVVTLSVVLANWLGIDRIELATAADGNSLLGVASSCCCAKRGNVCRCGTGCCGRAAKPLAKSTTTKSQLAIRLWLSCPRQGTDGLRSPQSPDWIVETGLPVPANIEWAETALPSVHGPSLRAIEPPTPPPRDC
ncbi:hypothetical protein CA54_37720 [Symmachiella macrocystis]|uniref:Uncharacterized protein n=1 Tax=Symmachiella macrocystis TaxID=2527985 RepID=A0A5C6BT03_9PLAN|nr:hypothetical protein CA54_37720 [Symmachiella macrocystis]